MPCLTETITEPLLNSDPAMNFLDYWQREKRPVSALFEVTSRCNLRCRHCYRRGLFSGEEMSLSEVTDMLDQLAASNVIFIGLTGGEPFLREDILDIVAAAKKRRFFVTLLTNGTLIDLSSARELEKLGIERVEVSFYGPTTEVHETMTGIPGSFESFLTGIRNLAKTSLKVVLKSTITTLNVSFLDDMKKFAKELSLPLRCDPKVLPSLDGGRDPLGVRLDPEEYPDSLWSELWGTANSSAHSVQENKKKPVQHHPVRPDENVQICKAGMVSCAVRPSGLVSPCIVLPLTVGDLRQETFEDIWRGARMDEYRQLTFGTYPQCRTCDLFFQCFRCPAFALLEEGDILKMPEFLCRSASCSQTFLQQNGRS
ncbi:MAG: radical SAM protein [bacterium]|nr:radical SAM protein [bacterium]